MGVEAGMRWMASLDGQISPARKIIGYIRQRNVKWRSTGSTEGMRSGMLRKLKGGQRTIHVRVFHNHTTDLEHKHMYNVP